jgi:hypothetical protein
MKGLLAVALSLATMGSALAEPAGQASTSSKTSTTTRRTTRKAASSTSSIAQQLQEMKQALDAQQQQIQQLRLEVEGKNAALQQAQQQAQQAQQALQQTQASAAEAQQKAEAAQNTASAQQDTVTRLNSDVKDVQNILTNTAANTQEEQKRVTALEGLLGKFRFTGDVRVRGEDFFQDCGACVARNRARIRVRFGIDGKLNEDFVGGFALATGTLGDPTTTNSTLTNFFDRHTIGLDRGYITFNPIAHKWLSLTGGKFAYTWQRTPVTFDSDLNPEGFSEKLSWDLKMPFIKNFTVQGMELVYNESSGGLDSWAYGGQIATKFVMGPWTMTPSYSLLKWNTPDVLLNASLFATQGNKTAIPLPDPLAPTTVNLPGEGPGCAATKASGTPVIIGSNCVFAPNGMTNAVIFDIKGKPRFLSRFFYGDLILNNTITTPVKRLPVNIIAEYERNLDAADHPVDALGVVRTDLGKQDMAYMIDASVGQTKNKNDVQVGYAWGRQEQDSVIASFNESDQRAPTNILQHRFYALWKMRTNTVASFTFWHGRTLNPFLENAVVAPKVTLAPGQTEPYLNRLQWDLIYSF